ncbi:MAG: lysozyme [Zoogloeaceae bacterium]|jgi:lysozyme|nr:lysozyme [Zoogloeaceae bacterium]
MNTSSDSSRRRVSPAGLALIREFELFSAKVYICPAGKPTIGYGHVLRPSDSFTEITQEQGEAMLQTDIAPVEIYLRAVLPGLTQNQFDALASLCFNIGLGNFERSTLLTRLKAGDLRGAALQFRRWIHANGKKLPGLVRRRAAEEALFMRGS